jgi:thiol-disulfide isomerase/thioredoxin
MPSPNKSTPNPVARAGAYLIDVRTLVALGITGAFAAILIGFYLWMVRPAAAREAEAACKGMRPEVDNPSLGTMPVAAPDFTVQTHDGKQLKLSDFRGKVVLLNFWASWCGVCKMEKPALGSMTRDLGSDDYVVLTLASDNNWAKVLLAMAIAHNPKVVPQKFKEENAPVPTMDEALQVYANALPEGTPYRVVLDPPNAETNMGEIAQAWGVHKVPDSFLVDRNGRIRYYFMNKRDWSSSLAETCLQSVIDE